MNSSRSLLCEFWGMLWSVKNWPNQIFHCFVSALNFEAKLYRRLNGIIFVRWGSWALHACPNCKWALLKYSSCSSLTGQRRYLKLNAIKAWPLWSTCIIWTHSLNHGPSVINKVHGMRIYKILDLNHSKMTHLFLSPDSIYRIQTLT